MANIKHLNTVLGTSLELGKCLLFSPLKKRSNMAFNNTNKRTSKEKKMP